MKNEIILDILDRLNNAQDETETIRIIRKHLMTQEQRELLFSMGLETADLLNGRYPCDAEAIIIEKFFRPWNTILGEKHFMDAAMCASMIDNIKNSLAKVGIKIKGIRVDDESIIFDK